MKAMSLEQANVESARWLRFLSRWALVTALAVLAPPAVVLGGFGIALSDIALGMEYRNLLEAVRVPAAYRLFNTLDALRWLMMGGTLLTLAVVLKSRAPIRALLIAACGIGMLTGALGGFMRLVAISDLAAHYAVATPAQQSALLPSMLVLHEIIIAHFAAGYVLASAGFLLVASVAFRLAAFPRWLAAWFVLAGVLSILQGVASTLGEDSIPVLLLTVLVVGILGLHAAIAVAFWRPSPARVSATASA